MSQGVLIRVARGEANLVFSPPSADPARAVPHTAAANRSRWAMDSFEINKVLGAVLATCLVLLSLNIASGALFAPHKPAKPGYNIEVREHPTEEAKPGQQEEPIATLLASADATRGETVAKKCIACHTFNKGGNNLVGPNLWGIVNRPRASVAGFNYSA